MPAKPTDKTEFQRYLNDNPLSVPMLLKISVMYAARPRVRSNFGFWLRIKHRPLFDRAYSRFWLKSTPLHGTIYH